MVTLPQSVHETVVNADGNNMKVVDQADDQDKDVGLPGQVGNGFEPCHDSNRGEDSESDLAQQEHVVQDNVIDCLCP